MGDIRRLKKLKTTSIGLSKEHQLNDVGSPYLHKKHKVGLTAVGNKGNARAIVYDQHIIDKLYLADEIDYRQHNVCNKYLGMLSASGAFVQVPSSERIFTGQGSFRGTPRCVILINVQRMLREQCGGILESRFYKIMCENSEELKPVDVKVVQRNSDALLDYWFIGRQSPVSLFQQALSNPI